jgi:hypothetical protein
VGRAHGVAEDARTFDLASELVEERVVEIQVQYPLGHEGGHQLLCQETPELLKAPGSRS